MYQFLRGYEYFFLTTNSYFFSFSYVSCLCYQVQTINFRMTYLLGGLKFGCLVLFEIGTSVN